MKQLSLVSAIIVFIFTMCYTMGPIAHCSSVNQKGSAELACYCCSWTDKSCPMYSCSCSKCKHDTSSDHFIWLFDALLNDFNFSVLLQPVYLAAGKAIKLKAIHCEVPYKPPKS